MVIMAIYYHYYSCSIKGGVNMIFELQQEEYNKVYALVGGGRNKGTYFKRIIEKQSLEVP